MKRFGYTGDPASCRWCGARLRVECERERATGNVLGVLRHEWKRRGKPERFKSAEFGHVIVAWHHPPRFDVETGVIRVGKLGALRPRDAAPIGEHEHDGAFCTWECGTRFADRMVDLGHVLEPSRKRGGVS